MINLIKADLYRVSRNSTIKNCIMIFVLFVIFATISFKDGAETYLQLCTSYVDNKVFGYLVGNPSIETGYFQIFRSSICLTIVIAIMMLFIIGDLIISGYTMGTLKNTISYGHNRIKVYLSSIVSIFLTVTIFAITTLGSTMLLWSIMYGEGNITADEIKAILNIIPVLLIILLGMASIYILISTITKNKAIVAALGTFALTYLGGALVGQVGSKWIAKVPVFMLSELCGTPSLTDPLGSFTINSLIIIVLTTIMGCIIFNRQEIR